MTFYTDEFYAKHDKDYKADTKPYVRCWQKHPQYLIDGMPITGGSCTSHYPDTDVFIGLDYNAHMGDRRYPWEEGVDVFFAIPDMGVPKDLQTFNKLLAYTADSMRAGKSVYVGCIGGHGRTGLFLAALTTFMTGNKDTIELVRKKYCKKAVESNAQINWLHKHFGIIKTKPTKGAGSFPSSKGNGKVSYLGLGEPKQTIKSDPLLDTAVGVTQATKAKYHHAKGAGLFMNGIKTIK